MDTRRPGASYLAEIRPERSRRRDRRHAVVLILPWALVVVLWVRVLDRAGLDALLAPGIFVTASVVVTLTITSAWIAHNLAIHREKGPRTGLPAAALDYDHDWTGRPCSADWDAVRDARLVFIAGVDRHKTFVPALEPASTRRTPAAAR